MPNGEDKNWVRLCAALEGFHFRYNSWPALVHLPELCLRDLKEHLFSPEDFQRIETKLQFFIDEDRFAALDKNGRVYDYMEEGFPDSEMDPGAGEWLGVAPRQH